MNVNSKKECTLFPVNKGKHYVGTHNSLLNDLLTKTDVNNLDFLDFVLVNKYIDKG